MQSYIVISYTNSGLLTCFTVLCFVGRPVGGVFVDTGTSGGEPKEKGRRSPPLLTPC